LTNGWVTHAQTFDFGRRQQSDKRPEFRHKRRSNLRRQNYQIWQISGAAFLAAGVAATAFAVKFAKDAIVAGEAAATANARIEQINTSMGLFGDSVNVVSERLIKYAEETARATGIDTNSIKATQAKLLTFKELAATANEVGGQFDRATQAAIDLASAGFGAAETNAVQLGKALNDPIKGITALKQTGRDLYGTRKRPNQSFG
jgi:hypothetical protein